MVVANKYDHLKNVESAGRRCLVQALRFISHRNGAALVFSSSRDKPARDLYRSAARSALFGSPPPAGAGAPQKWRRASSYDAGAASPYAVQPGCDTFEAILSSLPAASGLVKSDFLGHSGCNPEAGAAWARAGAGFFGQATMKEAASGPS